MYRAGGKNVFTIGSNINIIKEYVYNTLYALTYYTLIMLACELEQLQLSDRIISEQLDDKDNIKHQKHLIINVELVNKRTELRKKIYDTIRQYQIVYGALNKRYREKGALPITYDLSDAEEKYFKGIFYADPTLNPSRPILPYIQPFNSKNSEILPNERLYQATIPAVLSNEEKVINKAKPLQNIPISINELRADTNNPNFSKNILRNNDEIPNSEQFIENTRIKIPYTLRNLLASRKKNVLNKKANTRREMNRYLTMNVSKPNPPLARLIEQPYNDPKTANVNKIGGRHKTRRTRKH
jgi:hypothetical protein